ncbi:MAG: hypothetical protein EA398_11110 [Deltaproteobacteria bacterium]|nr:MAG: hypothetical protein EA398_11110 [Deltaproteobacteria bacterium]
MATVSFDHHLPCRLSADALHERLVAALVDTDEAPFWPHRLNRVRIAELQLDAPIAATYRAPGWPDTQRAYRVSEVRSGSGFSYAPSEGHPFGGEVHVDCVPAPDGSSTLHWRGTYHMGAWRPERLFFKAYFEPRFFAGLADGLRHIGAPTP